MTSFEAYLRLGFAHITDLEGYDHILFVIALCAVYGLRDWRRVLVLVTAFTVGHSITLALATLRLFTYRSEVIEWLIPITIFVTAVANLATSGKSVPAPPNRYPYARYGLALLFGLIHGLGFSNFLRSMLGREAGIVQPLLAFNIGLEIGQLLIVAAILAVAFACTRLLDVTRRDWNLVVSGAVAGIALTLIQRTWIF
jgi:hypothetical protein